MILYFKKLSLSTVASVIIARQHAVHAERDTVLLILPVCLSVRPMPVLYCVYYKVTLFNGLVGGITLVFLALPPLQNSDGNPSAGALSVQAGISVITNKRFDLVQRNLV